MFSWWESVFVHFLKIDSCHDYFRKCRVFSFIFRLTILTHFLATRNNLCHLILKDTGICALRRLPRLFDLSFWKKYRTHLQRPSGDFLGRDFEHLQQAFFSFCSKNLDKAALQSEKFATFNELVFSNVVVQVLKRFLDGPPANDTRWSSTVDGSNYGMGFEYRGYLSF